MQRLTIAMLSCLLSLLTSVNAVNAQAIEELWKLSCDLQGEINDYDANTRSKKHETMIIMVDPVHKKILLSGNWLPATFDETGNIASIHRTNATNSVWFTLINMQGALYVRNNNRIVDLEGPCHFVSVG